MVTRRQGLVWMVTAPLMAQNAGGILSRLGLGGPALKDGKIADGLREALRVGCENAVAVTGRKDGFYGNEIIRVLLPEPIVKMEKLLRIGGLGPKIDELTKEMNHAAESAAPLAKDIFLGAISKLTFEDVRGIWKGTDTAATEFFRRTTTPQLTEVFTPVVKKVMSEQGLSRAFEQFFDQVKKMPLMALEPLDIDTYVVDRTLFGLFYMMGREEMKIRKDPAARVTAVLKEVFGKR